MHRLLPALLLGALLVGATPTVALAATPAPAAPTAQIQGTGPIQVPIVGTNGTNAVATITSVQVVNGVLTAVGTITGDVTTLVSGIPVTTTVTNAPFTAPLAVTGGTCRILNLDLGPIHLDLLGLIVDVSAISVDITAQPGPGNLLGNLLCAVAHLLDANPSPNALQHIVNLLNQILAAL